MLLTDVLREAKCCFRCIIRLSGKHVRKLFSLDNSSEEFNKASKMHAAIDPKTATCHEDKFVCPLCLGLLADAFLRGCLSKMTNKLTGEKYDSETFSMNAVVPNSLNIRQHSLYHYAKEKLSEEPWKQDEVVSVKDALKYGLIEKMEEKSGKKCDVKSHLRITILAEYSNEKQEIASLPKINKESNARKRKKSGQFATQSIADIQSSLDELQSVETISKYVTCPPMLPMEGCILRDVTFFHEATYLAGRYNKYSRELSQTPWVIDGVRKTETSVQELVCEKIVEFFRADDLKFISAGREDVDVRMLGSGRPFAVELINPRKTKSSEEEIKKLELSINCSSQLIAVNQLQTIFKKDLALLKEGEEHKTKFYRATVYAKGEIADEKLSNLENVKDLVIAQKTPVRVLHRRPFAVREKTIHGMTATRIDDKHFTLCLSTQAGTYIKEFVHGDFKRTSPSLGMLFGVEVDIIDLDVEDVELEWPPKQQKEEK